MRLLLLILLNLCLLPALSAKTVLIYGHRGARGLSPENTLPAYHTALALGVDFVDMDINLSRDGQLVVSHDLSLNKAITRDPQGQWLNKTIAVKSLTLTQLQRYDVGMLNPHNTYAHYFPLQQAVAHTPIPSLEQVIDYVQQHSHHKVRFQIEIKTDPTQPQLSVTPAAIVKPLYKLLKRKGILHQAEIQAFDWRCLIMLNQLDPTIKTAYLTAYDTEPLNAKSPAMALAGVWTAGYKPQNFNFDYPRKIKQLGGKLWEPYAADLTKAELDEAHRLGLKVIVWSWPEQDGKAFMSKRIKRLIRWGVDGFINDRPDQLRGLLAALGYHLPPSFVSQRPLANAWSTSP